MYLNKQIIYVTYTAMTIGFINGPFEGREESGYVTITVGFLSSNNITLGGEISVLVYVDVIKNISNAATCKYKHDEEE